MQSNRQEKKFIKAVLDTNVLISALLYKKRLGIIADLIMEEGTIKPCFTRTTFLEFQETLQDKKFRVQFAKQSLTVQELTNVISEKGFFANEPKEIPSIITQDPADNHILACALASGAVFIISGDKHLLSLKEFQSIPIISPSQFLGNLKK